MLVAGSSIAENTPTSAGPAPTCHQGGLAVHRDRAPAQTQPAPATTMTLASGLAHAWLTVPLKR